MTTPNYNRDLTLADFDDMMAEAEGKPRKAPKLTSYGSVNPNPAPMNIPAPLPVHRPMPVYHQAPVYQPMPVQPVVVPPVPVYYTADPMPRASAALHALLFFTTGGIGNIIYQLHVIDKRAAWRNRHGIQNANMF